MVPRVSSSVGMEAGQGSKTLRRIIRHRCLQLRPLQLKPSMPNLCQSSQEGFHLASTGVPLSSATASQERDRMWGGKPQQQRLLIVLRASHELRNSKSLLVEWGETIWKPCQTSQSSYMVETADWPLPWPQAIWFWCKTNLGQGTERFDWENPGNVLAGREWCHWWYNLVWWGNTDWAEERRGIFPITLAGDWSSPVAVKKSLWTTLEEIWRPLEAVIVQNGSKLKREEISVRHPRIFGKPQTGPQ